MHQFRNAVSFLTRFPPRRRGTIDIDAAAAAPWFPVVGLLVGLIHGGIYLALAEVLRPISASALSAVAVGQLTGAFQLDGLVDVANTLGAESDTSQRRESYGLIALLFVVVVEIACLSSLSGWVALAATVAAHGVSRAVAGFAMVLAQPVPEPGLGDDDVEHLPRVAVFVTSMAVAAVLVVLFGVVALPIVLAAYGLSGAVVRVAIVKIDGISTDVLSAIQQLAKIVTLVIIVVAAEVITDAGMLGGAAF